MEVAGIEGSFEIVLKGFRRISTGFGALDWLKFPISFPFVGCILFSCGLIFLNFVFRFCIHWLQTFSLASCFPSIFRFLLAAIKFVHYWTRWLRCVFLQFPLTQVLSQLIEYKQAQPGRLIEWKQISSTWPANRRGVSPTWPANRIQNNKLPPLAG